jgi:sporulation protein YlmC with PRC-barrel domain
MFRKILWLVPLLLSGAAMAQTPVAHQPVAETGSTHPTPSLKTWDAAKISNPISANRLIGADLRDPSGKAIGSVEDVVVSAADHEIRSLILSRGTAVQVPWSDVAVTQRGTSVQLKTEQHLAPVNTALFWDANQKKPGDQAAEIRVSDLLSRNLLLNGAVRYGRVADLIFDQSGRMVAAEGEYNSGPTLSRFALPVPQSASLAGDLPNLYLPYDFADVKSLAPTTVGQAE